MIFERNIFFQNQNIYHPCSFCFFFTCKGRIRNKYSFMLACFSKDRRNFFNQAINIVSYGQTVSKKRSYSINQYAFESQRKYIVLTKVIRFYPPIQSQDTIIHISSRKNPSYQKKTITTLYFQELIFLWKVLSLGYKCPGLGLGVLCCDLKFCNARALIRWRRGCLNLFYWVVLFFWFIRGGQDLLIRAFSIVIVSCFCFIKFYHFFCGACGCDML